MKVSIVAISRLHFIAMNSPETDKNICAGADACPSFVFLFVPDVHTCVATSLSITMSLMTKDGSNLEYEIFPQPHFPTIFQLFSNYIFQFVPPAAATASLTTEKSNLQ
jgi:hypothetical protein